MSRIKITVLVDNYVDSSGLIAEHGLSYLIEVNGKRLLFDTGQGFALKQNVQNLGIDPKKIEFLILSHGHYDHTGGIEFVLGLKPNIKIYAHPKVCEPKYKMVGKNYKYIGIPTELRDKMEFVSILEPYEVVPGVFVSGYVPKIDMGIRNKGLYKASSTGYIADTFDDEIFLLIRGSRGVVVVSGCCHLGLKNTLAYANRLANGSKIRYYFGGLHLSKEPESELIGMEEFLQKSNIERFFVGHCTGLEAYVFLRERLGSRIEYFSTGKTKEVEI